MRVKPQRRAGVEMWWHYDAVGCVEGYGLFDVAGGEGSTVGVQQCRDLRDDG